MIGIICIICLFTIIIGLYRMYKDEHENYVKSHIYREPKFDKEKAKKEIYNYLKEKYKKINMYKPENKYIGSSPYAKSRKIVIDDNVIKQALDNVINYFGLRVWVTNYESKNETGDSIGSITLTVDDVPVKSHKDVLKVSLPEIEFKVKTKDVPFEGIYYYPLESIDDILNSFYDHRVKYCNSSSSCDGFVISTHLIPNINTHFKFLSKWTPGYFKLYETDMNGLLKNPKFKSYKNKLFKLYKKELEKYSYYIKFNNK